MHATLCGPGGEPPDAPTHWTEREYVWGPGYADDCLAQFGRENTPFFVLNDPHGTVLAITDAAGNVAEQYAWQPYGRLEVAESLLPHPVNRLGLHGMFFDHFVAGSDGRVLTPASEGLFHARNRHYHPRLGRFIQRDPNETGQPLLTALAFNGQTLSILVGGFDVQSLYGDGVNLYAAFGSNPIGNSDPLGLFSLLGTLIRAGADASLRASVNLTLLAQGHATAFSLVGGLIAAVNLYAMATDPEFLEIVMSQPNAFNLLVADIHAVLSAGGSIRGLLRSGTAIARLVPKVGLTSIEAEAWLAATFGGRSQVRVVTSLGPRIVDQVSGTLAVEAKSGYVAWSSMVHEQIMKDREIITRRCVSDTIREYRWYFFRSPHTGRVGADPRVIAELRAAGIEPCVLE